MSRNHTQRILSLSCVIAAAFLLFQGCESAEVDEASAAASSQNNGSTDSGSGEGSTVQKINVDPATATVKNTPNTFTGVKLIIPSPVSGYTYTWTLSNKSIGSLNFNTGVTVNYTPTSFGSEPIVQTITVIGKRSGSPEARGTSVITHQAN